MKQSAGKIALVTGASKGIGAGIAKAGFSVVVAYASSKEGADRGRVRKQVESGCDAVV